VRGKNSWLTLHEQSGDADLGQTLIRLARLAAAAHRYEVATEITDKHRDEGVVSINGQVLGPAVHDPARESQRGEPLGLGSVRTEANR